VLGRPLGGIYVPKMLLRFSVLGLAIDRPESPRTSAASKPSKIREASRAFSISFPFFDCDAAGAVRCDWLRPLDMREPAVFVTCETSEAMCWPYRLFFEIFSEKVLTKGVRGDNSPARMAFRKSIPSKERRPAEPARRPCQS